MKLTTTILALALSASTAAQAQQVIHTPSIPQSELDAQIAENFRAIDRTTQDIIDAGGPQRADFLPPWVAFSPLVHWEAFGEGKQIGGNGD